MATTSTTTDPRPSDAADPAVLLEAARIAAGAAADHIRSLDRSAIDREDKTSAHDIVTIHDKRCEEIIVENLERLVPGARIVGEEGGERAGASDVTFFVDPIDGTSNFAAGMPLFCVSIGAAIGDELVAGVIDAPVLGQVFTAGPDGAFLNGERLHPHATRAERDALVLSGFPTTRDLAEDAASAVEAEQEMLGRIGAVRNLGTAALELAWVAAGWADATMLTTINPWDVAAGFVLVRAVGGSIRTWPGATGTDLPPHEHPAYVACRGPERLAVLDEIEERLQARREAGATPTV